jgi:L-iditol 2-dehydrogenase
MKAAVLSKPYCIELFEVQKPKPQYGEVRIKLSKVGICGSDVHLFLGHRKLEKPTIIGHEGLGYIDKIGEGVVDREIGERVVIEPNIPCKNCQFCISGRGNICINKRVIGLNENGAFAEYVTILSDFAWNVSDEISDEDAVCIEPSAVAVHALFSSKAKPGDSIAIIGLGAIGLLLTQLSLALGYRVFVTEINQTKVKIAEGLGAISLIPKGNLEAQVGFLSKSWESDMVVAVFECAGSAQTASLATSAAPRGSEIILIGLSEKLATFQPLKITREGINIVPSIIYDHPFDFRRTLQLIKANVIKPSFIISNYTDLENLQSTMELAAKGNESKIIVEI